MSESSKRVDEQRILEREPQDLNPRVAEAQSLVQAAQDRLRGNPMLRLFPTEAARLTASNELGELEIGFEYRQRALRMAVDTKLKAVTEMCNHVLTTGRSEIRRERHEWFALQFQKLQEAMDNRADEFITGMESRFQRLDTMRDGCLKDMERERLENAVERFRNVIERMTDDFESIIHEGVSC